MATNKQQQRNIDVTQPASSAGRAADNEQAEMRKQADSEPTPQDPRPNTSKQPQVGQGAGLYNSARGIDEPFTITHVQGPHPDGGWVIDGQTNPYGPERERIYSVHLFDSEDDAREAGQRPDAGFVAWIQEMDVEPEGDRGETERASQAGQGDERR